MLFMVAIEGLRCDGRAVGVDNNCDYVYDLRLIENEFGFFLFYGLICKFNILDRSISVLLNKDFILNSLIKRLILVLTIL